MASVAPGASVTFNFQIQAPSTAGTYLFDWGMVLGGRLRFGQTSRTSVIVISGTPSPTPQPTISVSRPALVAGQVATMTWRTTNATSLTHVCTASGSGYTVNESVAVNDSRSIAPSSGWVGSPSSCIWTASGSGGTSTYSETMTTTQLSNSSVTYIHTDGLGSPVARTDASGNLISRTTYEPYGYVASGATPDIGFTGHVNDADTGLTYMQQRYYDPVAGRFLSIDPVVTDTGTGENFNSYQYVNNSPYVYIDQDGRETIPVEPPPIILPGPLPIIIQPVVIVGHRDPFGDPLSDNKFVSPVPNSRPASDLVRSAVSTMVQAYCQVVPMLCGRPIWSEGDRKTNPTKGESPVWQNLDNAGNGRKRSGKGSRTRFYEWDHTHNDIEVYDNKGQHQGSMDPTTGEIYKPPVPGRKMD